jgi:hypothetical protein|tara:strand:- start:101 stop:610 length:510 start_codon:yes stop_codon:yes gene_type:complete
MKKLLLFTSLVLLSCTKPANVQRMEELLHGDWYGLEITNHLIAQGLWDTLHPHSTTDLIATFDTLNNTFVVDSLGRTADSATLVIDSDSVITVIGADNAIDWSFDRQLINDFGQPVLDQLEASFNGNQKFKILRLTQDELVLYFDEVIPVSIQGFTADMELRHTQYWQK